MVLAPVVEIKPNAQRTFVFVLSWFFPNHEHGREYANRFGDWSMCRWLKAGYFPNAHKLTPGGRTSPYRIPEEDILAFEQKQRRSSPVT